MEYMRVLVTLLIFVSLISISLAAPTFFCKGIVKVEYAPNPAGTNSTVTALITGLTGCEGKLVYVKEKSCGGELACEAILMTLDDDENAGSCSFKAPGEEGTYSYFVCIDKDGDGVFSRGGERGYDQLEVKFEALPPGPISPEPPVTPPEEENETIENDWWKPEELISGPTLYPLIAGLILIGFIIALVMLMKPKIKLKKK